MVELDDPRTEALTATRLRIDERIASFIKGLNVVDDRLGKVVRPLGAGARAGRCLRATRPP